MSKKFEYTYSALTEQEREKVISIQNQYKTKANQKSKLEVLHQLDKKVKVIPNVISIFLGIVGTLIFGLGLTLVLHWGIYVWGIILGFVGCLPIGLAPLSHNKIYNKLKLKYGDEILKLSGELLNEQTKEL